MELVICMCVLSMVLVVCVCDMCLLKYEIHRGIVSNVPFFSTFTAAP
jgi:hypothetical protein